MFLVFLYIPDQYKTQEMSNRVIFEDPFSIRYIPDQYKTKQMSIEAVDDCLAPLKFVPDWFVTGKILDNALHSNDDILFHNAEFNKVTFIACQRQILATYLDKNKLDNDNFYETDLDITIHFRLLPWHINFKKRKALKKR